MRLSAVLLLLAFGALSYSFGVTASEVPQITREFLGLSETASKDEFLARVRVLANALLWQEISCIEHKERAKAFLASLVVEEDFMDVCRDNLKIERSNGLVLMQFKPQRPLSTIDGFMSLVYYQRNLRNDLLCEADMENIIQLQKSDNEECKKIGIWLEKKSNYIKAVQKDQMQSVLYQVARGRYVTLAVGRLFKNAKAFSLFQFTEEFLCETRDIGARIENRMQKYIEAGIGDSIDYNRKHRECEKKELLRISEVMNRYEKTREQCARYYSAARVLLLNSSGQQKGKDKYSMIRLLGNKDKASYTPDAEGRKRSIDIDVHDILPTELKGRRTMDIEGTKLVVLRINEFVKADKMHEHELFVKKDSSGNSDERGQALLARISMQDVLSRCCAAAVSCGNARSQECSVTRGICRGLVLDIIEAASCAARKNVTVSAITPVVGEVPIAKARKKKKAARHLLESCPQESVDEEFVQPCLVPFGHRDDESQESHMLPPGLAAEFEKIFEPKQKHKTEKCEDMQSQPCCVVAPDLPVRPMPMRDVVISQTSSRVIIKDLVHDVLLHLYLPRENGKKTIERRRINYTDTIQKWRTNPDAVLFDKGITCPGSPSYNPRASYRLPITDKASLKRYCLIHNFSPLVDDWIIARGLRQKHLPVGYVGKDCEAVVLPGHIEYEAGREESCLYCYIFSDIANALCFHRNIDCRPRAQLSQEYLGQGFFTFDDETEH